MRSLLRLLALLLSVSLIAAACGDDDPVEEADDAAESSDAAEPSDDETTDDGMAEEDEGPGTIVDVAVGAGSFETLVAAVTEAGLVETLSGDGPFTVFAPTDDAFAASLDGQSAATVQGEEIDIAVVDGNVMINNATVVMPDVEASNGIIHVIDAVILPPTIAEALLGDDTADADMVDEEAAPELGTIVDVADEAGIFTTLLAAGAATGLSVPLDADGDFTIFAPTDDAFAAALDALGLTAEELLADTDTVTSILTYHGLLGSVSAEEAIALDGQSVATINGAEITISVVDGAVVINDSATVIQADVLASNGVIHVIDAVLLPPA